MIPTIARETVKNVVPGTVIGVALGSPPLQAAVLNFFVAAVVRLTSHIVSKTRARRAARKAAKSNALR
jgi:hypothetical protein